MIEDGGRTGGKRTGSRGTAFYIEALLLAAVFTVVILTLTRVFAWSGQRGRDAALLTGAVWAGICIVFDLFGWVLVRHPWSLTFKEFYLDYQPWITLIYLAIFLGPVVGFYLCTL